MKQKEPIAPLTLTDSNLMEWVSTASHPRFHTALEIEIQHLKLRKESFSRMRQKLLCTSEKSNRPRALGSTGFHKTKTFINPTLFIF